MSELADVTAIEAARRIENGEITSEELMAACLARIDAREGEVQAWTHVDPDYAMEQARQRDRERAEGNGTGPLHGVPVGIKDIIDTADMPTEMGCPIFDGNQPAEDAACVSALKAVGAIILGKTVTTELATRAPGKTRNPVNPAHTPGGSSSGSAAAVGAGMVPLALGTQTTGSVIRPAAFCGVYGMKPTYGLIPRKGVLNQSESLDTVGVYGRSIDDIALAASCLSLYDPRDAASFPRSRPDLLAISRQEPPLAPSFAFVRTSAWRLTEPATRDAFAELVAALGERCDEVELPSVFDDFGDWQRTIQGPEMARSYGPLYDAAPDKLSDHLKERIIEARQITGVHYLKAKAHAEVLYSGLERIFERYHAIITPAAPGPAPKGIDTTGDPIFCALWTMTGVPAVSLPLLEANGLPMGVQLVGPRRDDGRLLRTARWLERHLTQATG